MTKYCEWLQKMIKKLEQLKQRRQQLNAQIQNMAAAEKAKERKRDTRRKILIGAYFLNQAKQNNTMEALTQQIVGYLTRSIDRVLFDLSV